MSDIFVSYSSKDRERAGIVARALEARGWSVWWDRTIPPGRQYDDVIEEALAEARVVVVLWSKASSTSTWVKNEASDAVGKKALIPAIIEDEVKIPFEFRRIQAADLSRWQGDASAPEFVQFCDAIAGELDAGRAGPAPTPAPSPAPPAPPLHEPARRPVPALPPAPTGGFVAPPLPVRTASKKPYVIGGIVVVVLLGIASFTSQESQREPTRRPMPSPMPADLSDEPSGGVNGRSNAGIHQNLVWHDYVLAYSGNVAWDGASNNASIAVNVSDSNTHQPLGLRMLQASVNPNAPGQIVVSTSVPVNGDSRTPGPHSHSVNLVFQAQGNGTWTFLRNCMAPNDCY